MDGLYIAIGKANEDGDVIISTRKGEAVEIVHYLNDKVMKEF
jgi:Predicted RNA-binding protein (contains PUA domain)